MSNELFIIDKSFTPIEGTFDCVNPESMKALIGEAVTIDKATSLVITDKHGVKKKFIAEDKTLELIDKLSDTRTLAKETPLGDYFHKAYAEKLKKEIKKL